MTRESNRVAIERQSHAADCLVNATSPSASTADTLLDWIRYNSRNSRLKTLGSPENVELSLHTECMYAAAADLGGWDRALLERGRSEGDEDGGDDDEKGRPVRDVEYIAQQHLAAD